MAMHSIELPRPIHARAKALAAERHVTLEALLSKIVNDYATLKTEPQVAEAPTRDVVRVKLGVQDADWDAGSARARVERTTLTAIVLDELSAD